MYKFADLTSLSSIDQCGKMSASPQEEFIPAEQVNILIKIPLTGHLLTNFPCLKPYVRHPRNAESIRSMHLFLVEGHPLSTTLSRSSLLGIDFLMCHSKADQKSIVAQVSHVAVGHIIYQEHALRSKVWGNSKHVPTLKMGHPPPKFHNINDSLLPHQVRGLDSMGVGCCWNGALLVTHMLVSCTPVGVSSLVDCAAVNL